MIHIYKYKQGYNEYDNKFTHIQALGK